MTVISTVITRELIAFGADSFTTKQENGNAKLVDSKHKKIVPVDGLAAAMAFWGLATRGSFSTHEFLVGLAASGRQHLNLDTFAQHVRDSLDAKLQEFDILQRGIGIHLAGFEQVDGYRVPELFLITTFKDTQYRDLKDLELTRETFGALVNVRRKAEHGRSQYRHIVREILEEKSFLQFNNGDPEMFNPVARSVVESLSAAGGRGNLNSNDRISLVRSLATLPVEIVSRIQRDTFLKSQRVVGGKTRDLVITADGLFH